MFSSEINIPIPCTVAVRLKPDSNGNFPYKIRLHSANGELYYLRELDGTLGEVNINIVHAGKYTSNIPVDVQNINTLKRSGYDIDLPQPERNRVKPFKIVENDDLGVNDTPARIFTDTGVIEVGQKFKQYPPPIRLFILLHEFGHFYYKTEWKTDLFALKLYLMLGYNESNAFYALSKVLGHSEQSVDRIKRIFNAIMENKK